MFEKKIVRKPSKKTGCQTCLHRKEDFVIDESDDKVIRCYCSVRFTSVDAEIMSKDCDFYTLDLTKLEKEEKTGL